MISSVEMGRRITQARKDRGLTQDAVARAIGLGRTTLVSLEKGERPATESEIVQIASTLGIAIHALVAEHASMGSASPRFRLPPAAARGGDLALDAMVSRLLGLARKYAELESINQLRRVRPSLETLQVYRADIRPSDESYEQACAIGEDAALTVRAILRLGEGPVVDLAGRLEREAGLRIFHLRTDDGTSSRVAGIFIWSDELGGCVAINSSLPIERQRLSLAHEFGHFLRDREEGDVLPESPATRREPSEGFAERFATCFLLPETSLRRDVAEARRADGFTVASLIQLAHSYGVSLQATTLRLEELGLLPRGTHDRVAGAIKVTQARSTLGLKHDQYSAPTKFPARYTALVVRAHAAELLSEGEVAEYLEIDRLEARAVLQRANLVDDGLELEMPLAESLEAP